MPQLVRASCLLGPGMQALGEPSHQWQGGAIAWRAIRFRFRFCLAAAVAAAADRVNTAVELVKSFDYSLIHS